MLNLGNPELAFRTAMLPNDGVACPCGLGQSVGEPSDKPGRVGLVYAAIEPCYAGGRAEPRRAKRMKRRRDVIMALAVRERELNGQTRKGGVTICERRGAWPYSLLWQ